MVTVCTWLFFAFTWLTGVAHPAGDEAPGLLDARGRPGAAGPSACARRIVRGRASFVQNTVIVGAGDVGQTIAEKLLRHPEYGVNVVGFVDSEPKEPVRDVERPDDPRPARAARRESSAPSTSSA